MTARKARQPETTGSATTGSEPRPGRAEAWLYEPVPLARVFWLRIIVYGFVPIDVLLTQSWVRGHTRSGSDLYHPLQLARLLHLPTPTLTTTTVLAIALAVSALVAATGRRPRVSGSAVAVLYLVWMLVAMSYGKVDHDRLAFLVALVVLPTVPATSAHDRRRSPAAGWAMRCIQVAIVLTYFYAAWAKIRFGGWDWPTGATLERALLRRSTPVSGWLIDRPAFLVPMQFAMIGFELASPLILLARSDRARTAVAGLMWGFHLTVFAGVTIIFLPHCVAICAFLPLERMTPAGDRFRFWINHRRQSTPRPTAQPQPAPSAT
ncbi:MAG: conserved rane protein of unknown function [Pseudonocardiales bacterium]|nr:conserved rane protein of unknown function [Pseudonocardiales bacterium]